VKIAKKGDLMRKKVRTQKKLEKHYRASSSIKPVKMKHVQSAFQITRDDIYTGYLAEKIHHEMRAAERKLPKST